MIAMDILKGPHKGQFSIQYLIAFVIFSTILLYVSFQMADVLPDLLTERTMDRKDSEAQRIATFLAETDKGFAEKPYLWNATKIGKFREDCKDDYFGVRNSLGLDRTSGFSAIAYKKGVGSETVLCEGPSEPKSTSIGRARRFGYVKGDEIYKMVVTVW